MESRSVAEPSRHPRPGRPRRPDWRLGDSLAGEELGVVVLAEVSWTNQRVRARLVEVGDDGLAVLEVMPGGRRRRVAGGQVARYHPIECEFLEGDFVVMVGVPEGEWRGVVVGCDGPEVEVESNRGTVTMYADELESAWSRDPKPPATKRGPIAADPVVEAVNTEAAEARRLVSGRDEGVDEDGWAV